MEQINIDDIEANTDSTKFSVKQKESKHKGSIYSTGKVLTKPFLDKKRVRKIKSKVSMGKLRYRFYSPDRVVSKHSDNSQDEKYSGYISKFEIVKSLYNVKALENMSEKWLYELAMNCSLIIMLNNEDLDLFSNELESQKFPSVEGQNIKLYSNESKINEDAVFIIKSGEAELSIDGNVIRKLRKFEIVSLNSLLYESVSKVKIKSTGVLEVLCFYNKELKYVIDESFLPSNSKMNDSKDVQLDGLEVVKSIGEGGFSTVQLVRNKQSNHRYALKSYPIEKLGNEISTENINRECDILLELNHPFVVKLYRPMQDNRHFHFLMEYIKGKELWSIMREVGEFSSAMIQFSIACLTIALEYIHKKNIVYRDLKPENIMVTDRGFLKLVDFGIAKKLTNNRTDTTIGTPHYMSPEMINGKGYAYSTDFWSLGICLYEIVFGDVPFGNDKEDPFEIFECIQNQ